MKFENIMTLTDSELGLIYGLVRSESNRIDREYGLGTEFEPGSYAHQIQVLDAKLSAERPRG